MSPFLSICVLTYRRPETLARTLQSLIPQVVAWPEVEIVVCDNASGDGTAALVESLQRECPALRYHCNAENRGFDGNVVTCLEQGRGEYVAFFSDDDLAPEGHVEFLVTTLRQEKPAVLYINHRPFLHNDPAQLGPPASPVRGFNGAGEAFLLIAGLGFISSLIVLREPTLCFSHKVVFGAGGAHVDMTSRLVLTHPGPCLYCGSYSVLARYDYSAASILIPGCVSLAKLYRTLVAEGLLSRPAYRQWLRGQIAVVVPRQVVSARGQGKGEYPLRGMLELYGSERGFYFRILPLYLIPRFLLRFAYQNGRKLLHAWRRGQAPKSS